MRFEQVKRGRKDNKVYDLINQFLKSKFDEVEVFNENDYESNARMVAAMRFTIKNHFDGMANVSKIKDRVYLYKIKENKSEQKAN